MEVARATRQSRPAQSKAPLKEPARAVRPESGADFRAGILDPRLLLSLQASAGNAAVGQLLQRAPHGAAAVASRPARPKAPAKPVLPPVQPGEIVAEVDKLLSDRYQAMQAAADKKAAAHPGGAPADKPVPLPKSAVVGSVELVARKWPSISRHILRPRAEKVALQVLNPLYTAEGVRNLARVPPEDRAQAAEGVRTLLVTYASDGQYTGTKADVEPLVKNLEDSFYKSYAAEVAEATEAGRKPIPPELFFKQQWPAIDAQLAFVLPDAEREKAHARAFDTLVRYATGGAQTGESVVAEWGQLSDRVRHNIENDQAGYVAIRKALFDTFHSIETANKFYATLVGASFGGKSFNSLVHPVLQDRLNAATTKLAQLDPTNTVGQSAGLGGFNLRENRNSPSSLSDHSFGFAIDVNADTNPNIPQKVANELYPLIEALTGQNVKKDASGKADGKNFVEGLPAAQAQAEAERLKGASDRMKAIFKDEASLKQGMADYAAGYASQKKFSTPGTASGDQLYAGAMAAAGGGKKQFIAFARSIFNGQPPPPGQVGPSKGDMNAVAAVLVSMYRRFREGQRVNSSGAIASSAGQVARFGFLNLDPRLVAALAGSDGGGLKWLGAQTGGVKDFMHFQLPDSAKPNPAAAAAAAPASAQQPVGIQRQVAAPAPTAAPPKAAATPDAGTAAGGALKKVAGDTSSTKVVRVSWTFDDGPSALTEQMAKAAGNVPGTWFIMRNQFPADEKSRKKRYAELKAKQDAGQEFGIHAMHATESHRAWFPHGAADAYDDIKTAMSDLTAFHKELTAAGIQISFVRAPYGLYTEIVNYLRALGVKDKVDAIAREILAGNDPKGAPAAALKMVKADVDVMKATLSALGVHEWGGDPKMDPGIQGWEAEDEPKGLAKLQDDAVSRFEGIVRTTARDGGPHSLVILAHDTALTSKQLKETGGIERPAKLEQDIKEMEAYATAQKVRVEYYTMSELYGLVVGKNP